jgi:Fic family protein
VVGNVAAMALAIELGAQRDALRLEDLESMHGLLMSGSPFLDDQQRAGMLRDDVSFIGGTSPATANFVPPPPEAVPELISDLLAFTNERHDLSPIVVAAIAHAQFETIHPFHDGNGRVGRCLIHTLLRRHGSVTTVTPPVSLAIAQEGSAYVEGLIAFREGGVDQWISQFALIVTAACHAALRFAADAHALQEDWLDRINARRHARGGRPVRADATAHRLLGLLPDMPVLTAASVVDRLGVSWKAALDGIAELEAVGILVQTSIGRRNRVHEARDLFGLLDAFERQPW